MYEYSIISWIKVIFFIIPIWFSGLMVVRSIVKQQRVELTLPAGLIMGISLYIFFLNLFSYILPLPQSIDITYLVFFLGGIIFGKIHKFGNLDLPRGKTFYFWILSLVFWTFFLAWKSNFALIGSDTNLYYSIATTFIKGNFPPKTPWQPDLNLSYHLGAFQLLGAFHFLTKLSFQFLHLFFSTLFIICSVQIFIWIWGRSVSLFLFVLTNFIALAIFVSFGFFYLVIPSVPFSLPKIENFQQLILWIRDLPTVNQAIEVYGAPVNLDSLIYFIFHAFGLAIFLMLLTIILNFKKGKNLIVWTTVLICLASLALINESVFIAVALPIILGIVYLEKRNKTLARNLPGLVMLVALFGIVVLLQGGVISSVFLNKGELNQSIVIFPKKEDIKDDFVSYHYNQQISKILPKENIWLPFHFYHVGLDLLIIISILILCLIKIEWEKKLILIILFLSGTFSLLAYHFIVPKYLVANGNRFLVLSFIYFSILILLAIIDIAGKIFNGKYIFKKAVIIILVLWIFLPTVLPPLALLSKTRFGEDKLIPKIPESSAGILWLKNNTNFNDRVVVLDRNAPHPSGQVRALVEAGVFAPVFPGNIRAFTIEASPEYIDITYSLSPEALNRLGVSLILIDSVFYETLPDLRKIQLKKVKYFEILFDNSTSKADWEKIYKVEVEYLKNGEELEGTLEQLKSIIPKGAKLYIDKEENFKYNYLRRPIIFILRDRDLYYYPQSGVYLNVEVYINQKNPQKNIKYDYLILGKKSDPKIICECRVKLIWQGLKDEILLWKVLED